MLILYVITGCPFCQKVLDYGKENDIEFDIRNIAEEENLNQLLESGGKRQAPYLVDEDKGSSMYESNDIIEHLKENY